MIDLPPPGFEQTIEAIVKCDIPRANVRIRYEDYLQSDEVTIKNLDALTDEKLRCLKSAVHPFYILTIQDQAQQSAFYEFSRREDRPGEQAKAREWARSKNLLDQLPSFDAAKGLEAFGRAVEATCGLEPGSALIPAGGSSLTVRPDFPLSNSFKKSARATECLLNVFASSDATEKGVGLGFIGNEAFVEETKK